METLLILFLVGNGIGVLLSLSVSRTPQAQGILGSVCVCVASPYCQRKLNWADVLSLASSMNVEQSVSYEFM